MAYGLTCYNSDGYIQVSDSFKTFVLLAKGSGNLDGTQWSTAYPDTILGSHLQISYPNSFGYPPVVAIRSDARVQIYRTRLVSGNWVYDVVSEQGAHTNLVEWYIFGPCPNTVTDPYGITIRDSSGALTYHSGYKPMVVKSFKNGSGVNDWTFDIGAGRKIAVGLLTLRWSWTGQVPAGAWQQFLTATTVIMPNSYQGTINQTVIGASYKSTNFGFPGGSGGEWAAIAVDVTNY